MTKQTYEQVKNEGTNVEQSIERIDKDIEDIIQDIESNINEQGLIPELNERGKAEIIDGQEKYGFNSEMLGYALRIAVGSNNRDLFERLHKGYIYLKTIHPKGLIQARLTADLSVDSQGNNIESWADGVQDTAVALIEAGQKWGQNYIEEGKELATNFLDSSHIMETSDDIYIFNAVGREQPQQLGKHLLSQDISMWNFKLYNLMQELEPQEPRWEKIYTTGTKLINKTMQVFVLPPNNIPVLNDEVISYEELEKLLEENAEILIERPEVRAVIKEKILGNPYAENRLYGWDASRIPFRLTDTMDTNLIRQAVTINQRLEKLGKVGVNIQAETGDTSKATTYSPIMAPLLMADIYQKMDIPKTLKTLANITQLQKSKEKNENFKTPLYWKLWEGLSLLQMKESINKLSK